MMTFTGNSSNKINHKSSNFYVDFYQLEDENDHSRRIWKTRVVINDDQLHTVGQHLGGVSFNVPVYDRGSIHPGTPTFIESPVNVYFQFVKTKKNRPSDIEAKSDPRFFQYRPSNQMRMMKRPKRFEEPEGDIMKRIHLSQTQQERPSVLRRRPAPGHAPSPAPSITLPSIRETPDPPLTLLPTDVPLFPQPQAGPQTINFPQGPAPFPGNPQHQPQAGPQTIHFPAQAPFTGPGLGEFGGELRQGDIYRRELGKSADYHIKLQNTTYFLTGSIRFVISLHKLLTVECS